jgi:hypothetical protein
MKTGDLVRIKYIPGWRSMNWIRIGRLGTVLERAEGGVKVMLSDGKVLCDIVENWEVISEGR